MKKKNLLLLGGLGLAVWLAYKAFNAPQVRTRPVYQPVKSAKTYDHLYQDAHLTEVVNKVMSR